MSPADRDQTPPSGEEGRDADDSTGLTDEFERVLGEGEDQPQRPEEPEAPEEPDEPRDEEPEAEEHEAEEHEAAEEPQGPEAAEAAEAGADDSDLARRRLLQETVEADVLALGDAEEAAEQEAVEHYDEGEEEDADAGEDLEPESDEEDDEDEAADSGETVEKGAIAAAAAGLARRSKSFGSGSTPPPRQEAPAAAVAEAGDDEGKPPKSRLWLRFLTAAFVIVISMASATAVSGLLFLTDLAKGLGGLEGVRAQLEKVDGGEPQNILILGSDQRPGDPSARSDTTMLLRLDPDENAIALFSLPRDLRVSIPGHGVDRLNAAYSYGGPKLTLETVKQVTGLKINHVVNVDFNGFYRAVNAIDCVYVDVDRSYYVPPEATYAEINIPAGYQLLCGERALQYVRFRHADTDITRSARQQDFLREARQKVTPQRLFRDRDELIDIFKKYTTSDIEEVGAMVEVLKLFLSVADAPVKEIHFEGNIGPSYITFSQEQMQQATEQFMGIEDTPGSRGGGALDDGGDGGDGGGGGDGGEPEPSLIDSAAFGRGVAEDIAGQVDFPVYYPTKLTQGAEFSGDSRAYEIEADDGKIHDIYKIVIQTPLLGEYFGISGTSWEDPPILANPSETREIGGREFDLFYDGDRLRLVAWHTDKGSYWLNNSLLQSIDEQEMLEIAETMEDVAPR
jgi:polyisoprenyl-teichoic acid--peptidoglycan teichoic acid transferase